MIVINRFETMVVQVTMYRRLLIGLDDHIGQSEAYHISEVAPVDKLTIILIKYGYNT